MNEVAVAPQNQTVLFGQEQVDLLKRTIAKDATNDELQLFISQCKRTGLDPFTRQIYFIKDKQGKVTVCSSIDGLRLIAERSNAYEGQTKSEWCGPDGIWKDIWLSNTPPKAARVGVYKTKFREPVYGVAIFDEYAGKYSYDDQYGKYKKGDLTHMWAKMPALMIAKVAEALALRKAFPNDLSGIYSSEEGELISAPEVEIKQEISVGPEVKKMTFVAGGSGTNTQPTDAVQTVTQNNSVQGGQNPGDHVVSFGKFRGMAIKDLQPFEVENYISYLESNSAKANKPLTNGVLAFVTDGKKFLAELAELVPLNENDEINF